MRMQPPLPWQQHPLRSPLLNVRAPPSRLLGILPFCRRFLSTACLCFKNFSNYAQDSIQEVGIKMESTEEWS